MDEYTELTEDQNLQVMDARKSFRDNINRIIFKRNVILLIIAIVSSFMAVNI